jgi:hypothetical protein
MPDDAAAVARSGGAEPRGSEMAVRVDTLQRVVAGAEVPVDAAENDVAMTSLDADRQSPGFITDDELTALALAADPDAPLAADAVPLADYLAEAFEPLPAWYMAPVMARHSGRRRQAVIAAVVGAFLLIEAFGLCSTYGQFPFH